MSPIPSSADLRFAWIGFHAEGLAALGALLDAGAPIQGVLTLRPDHAEAFASLVRVREVLCDWRTRQADFDRLRRDVEQRLGAVGVAQSAREVMEDLALDLIDELEEAP